MLVEAASLLKHIWRAWKHFEEHGATTEFESSYQGLRCSPILHTTCDQCYWLSGGDFVPTDTSPAFSETDNCCVLKYYWQQLWNWKYFGSTSINLSRTKNHKDSHIRWKWPKDFRSFFDNNMFHTCSPFLSFPLVHSLPENQIAALKGKGHNQNSQKKAQEKTHTDFPTDHTASQMWQDRD